MAAAGQMGDGEGGGQELATAVAETVGGAVTADAEAPVVDAGVASRGVAECTAGREVDMVASRAEAELDQTPGPIPSAGWFSGCTSRREGRGDPP
jgi:hypothetical protein